MEYLLIKDYLSRHRLTFYLLILCIVLLLFAFLNIVNHAHGDFHFHSIKILIGVLGIFTMLGYWRECSIHTHYLLPIPRSKINMMRWMVGVGLPVACMVGFSLLICLIHWLAQPKTWNGFNLLLASMTAAMLFISTVYLVIHIIQKYGRGYTILLAIGGFTLGGGIFLYFGAILAWEYFPHIRLWLFSSSLGLFVLSYYLSSLFYEEKLGALLQPNFTPTAIDKKAALQLSSWDKFVAHPCGTILSVSFFSYTCFFLFLSPFLFFQFSLEPSFLYPILAPMATPAIILTSFYTLSLLRPFRMLPQSSGWITLKMLGYSYTAFLPPFMLGLAYCMIIDNGWDHFAIFMKWLLASLAASQILMVLILRISVWFGFGAILLSFFTLGFFIRFNYLGIEMLNLAALLLLAAPFFLWHALTHTHQVYRKNVFPGQECGTN